MYKCDFCNKDFKTSSSLNHHIKTTKYCLEIQNKKNNELSCKYCSNIFTSKQSLQYHLKICKNKDNLIIKNFKDKSEKLEEENISLKSLITKLETEVDIYKKDHETISNIAKHNEILKPIQRINNLILNNITIIVREDGYINLTQLCKAGGKEFYHWKENKNCEAFLQALSSSTGIPRDDLIKYETGSNENRATWGHRLVAIEISRWISPEFGVKIIRWTDEILITGKVELGHEKSNIELENIYQEKINNLQNKLKNYETTIFNRNIDYCPIEYYGKDIVYFLKFNIPTHLYSEYISKYPNVDNMEYRCIEFGVTSNIEERIKSHKRDKKKENLIFLHAIEIKNRYISSKMEFYIKRISQQLNINFDYEKRKECILVNEEMFNVLVNKINTGLSNIGETETGEESYTYLENGIEEDYENEINKYKCEIDKDIAIKKLDNEIEIKKLDNEKEIKNTIIKNITDLLKNNIITLEEYKKLLNENIKMKI